MAKSSSRVLRLPFCFFLVIYRKTEKFVPLEGFIIFKM